VLTLLPPPATALLFFITTKLSSPMSNTINVPVDRSTTLCLACSCSLPRSNDGIFITACCARPICPTCLSSNPRLARYNPCLACLGGVGAVSSKGKKWDEALSSSNVDGAVRDEDTFMVGDDEDEDEDNQGGHIDESSLLDPPPPYRLQSLRQYHLGTKPRLNPRSHHPLSQQHLLFIPVLSPVNIILNPEIISRALHFDSVLM
jgi:hypothetical protein